MRGNGKFTVVYRIGGWPVLNVYLYGQDSDAKGVIPKGKNLIQDPESAFTTIKIRADSTDAKLVEAIEAGKLIDSRTFVDRFGVTLYTTFLSTGCKAALLVNNTDAVVGLGGCGFNAISAIFSFCRNGSIALETPDMDLTDLSGGEEVSISIEGYIATSVKDAYRALEDGLWLGY